MLKDRLVHAIDEWCTEFDRESPGSIEPLLHEIRIRNQVIYLDPPIEMARQEWLAQFQGMLGMCRSSGTAADFQASSAASNVSAVPDTRST